MSTTTEQYEDDAVDGPELFAPDALDEGIETDEEPTVDETDEAETAAGPAKAKSNNKALIRRVALKAQELLDAPTAHIAVAAHLMGSSTELPELTTAIMTASRASLNPLNDVKELTEVSPLEAGISVVAMGRPRIRGLWNLLASAGVVSRNSLPPADAKAAMAIVTALTELDDSTRDTFDGAAKLLRKS